MNVLRLKNPLTIEEGIRLDIFSLGILILDMLDFTKGKQPNNLKITLKTNSLILNYNTWSFYL